MGDACVYICALVTSRSGIHVGIGCCGCGGCGGGGLRRHADEEVVGRDAHDVDQVEVVVDRHLAVLVLLAEQLHTLDVDAVLLVERLLRARETPQTHAC